VERLEVIFVWVAFLAYATAFVFFLYYLFNKRELLNRIGLAAAVLGFVMQTAAIALRDSRTHHAPVVGAYESLLTISWALVVVYLVLEWRTHIKALGLYVMPVVVLFLGIAWTQYEAPAAIMPALKSDIVVIHVIVIFTAIASFTVAGGAAVIYLVEQRQLKRGSPGRVLGRLPSLGVLDRLISHAIMFGLPFLTMGIAAGVIRAVKFGVKSWYTDPLVLLAIGAWVIYAVFLYLRYARGWHGRRPAWLAIAGLVCLLVIRFVAVPYLSNFHTWGS
jgi:ABC-type transport system involved in cytochrome c biogenesis permease subunit